MGAVGTVEPEVRELVRRRGLDPVVDRSAMRSLIDEVVSEYGACCLTLSLPPLAAAVSRRSRCTTPSPATERSSAAR